ncbi:cation diffusion facilitator family transporter [Pedobacter glucosidilyticus]|uniref:cation diffusion facilitator family transporter n=1 Tax=Pedobacter glucosidilyticus TaxID=1122941 RepID=UPI000424F30F|nr:cation diffusion facilitator family transporter [Pedobacter glucosidilyticus]
MKSKKQLIFLSLAIGLLLMLVKFTAYFITQSNAILTDAAESIVNVIASAFAFYSIYLSSQPKDQNHPYGHGKVEFFSAFVEGVLIIIAGIIIFFKSIYNAFYPQEIKDLFDGSLLIGLTGLVNGLLGFYLVNRGKVLNSLTLHADGKHLITDAVSSFGLMIGLLVMAFTGLNWLDSLISIGLALYIISNGYKLMRLSVGGLMDESDVNVVENVIKQLSKNRRTAWIDVHNLRIQRYGDAIHIDCHVTLPYYFDLNKVHAEITDIDKIINENVANTELFIHTDPCVFQCCHYCNVANCPVRQEPKTKEIAWDIDNVTKNHKHFEVI